MGRAPFFIPLIGLIFGILISEYLPGLPFWGIIIGGLVGLVYYIFRPGVFPLVLMFTSLGWGVMEFHKPYPLAVTGEGYYSATVLHAWETDGNAMMGIVEVDSVNSKPFAPFNITVQMIGHRNVIQRGERIAFHSAISYPEVKSDIPDVVTENSLNRRYGVVGFTMVLPDSLLYCVEGKSLSAGMYRLNRRMIARLSMSDLDDGAFSLLSAMLLGDKSMLTPDEVNAYSASGLSHLLALSGTHVAVIVSLIALALFPLTLARQNKVRFVISIVLLWFYALLTGLSPSVVRAAVMATVYLIGRVLERRSVPINSLCFAAWIILIVEPVELFMPGFQMSFAAVAGIIVFYPLLNQVDRRKHPWLYFLWSYPAVSISAMSLTGLIATWYFHTFPLYFLPANLLVVPLMPLILGLGLLLLLAPTFYPAAWAVNGLCWLLDSLARWIAELPQAVVGSVYLPLWIIILLPLVLLAAGFALQSKRYAAAIACAIVFVTACVAERITRPQFPFEETFELDGATVIRQGKAVKVYTEIKNETDRREATVYFTRRLRHYCARRKLPPPEVVDIVRE